MSMGINFYNIKGYRMDWKITGLSNYFSTDYYLRAGISLNPIVNEEEPPLNILGWVDPVFGNRTHSAIGKRTDIDDLPKGNPIMIYSWVQAKNYRYYPVASKVLFPRPDAWEWGNNYVKGMELETYELRDRYYAIVVNAWEWKQFVDNVKQVRQFHYQSADDFPFTEGEEGDELQRLLIETYIAIDELRPPYSVEPVIEDGEIKAIYLNSQRDAINSIEIAQEREW